MPTMTGDAVVELIRNDERGFVGTGEIADHFDVTRQAVRNRREELRHHPALGVDKVGKTTVFYLDGAESSGETHTMHQMDAKRIGTIALGISVVSGVIAQVPLQLAMLVLLGLVGVVMILWGVAPLLTDRNPGSASPGGVANE